jgi:hypothetical protein
MNLAGDCGTDAIDLPVSGPLAVQIDRDVPTDRSTVLFDSPVV